MPATTMPPGGFLSPFTSTAATQPSRATFAELRLPALCGWMGLSAPPQDIPAFCKDYFLPGMALAESRDRTYFFHHHCGKLQKTIRTEYQGPSSDQFSFPTALALHLGKMQYQVPEGTRDWHMGLGPGVAMTRDKTSLDAQKRHFANMEDNRDFGATSTIADPTKLEICAAIPPQNPTQFFAYLRRLRRILLDWLTITSDWALLVSHTYEVITDKVDNEITDQMAFFKARAAHIIWGLTLAARQFFSTVRTAEDLAFQGPVRIHGDLRAHARELVNNKCYPRSDLPPVLAALLPPDLQRQVADLTTQGIELRLLLNQQRNNNHNQERTTGAKKPKLTTPPPPAPSALSDNPHVHVPTKNLLAQYQNLEAPQLTSDHKTTKAILKAAGRDVRSTLTFLGLASTDCLNWHLRGKCNADRCKTTGRHVPKSILEQHSQTLHSELVAGIKKLKLDAGLS